MSYKKLLKFIFVLATIFFIAKPFVVSNASEYLQSSTYNTILVKAFCKVKTEHLYGARSIKDTIQLLLNNPPDGISILALLAILYPILFNTKTVTYNLLYGLSIKIISPQAFYLLNRQLLI